MFSDDSRIASYEFAGLKGRYIKIEAKNPKNKRVFLVIYGQHASIERCMALCSALSNFGMVYLVDNPGFGGMDASYKIGREPTLDFYAEHIKNVFDNVLPKNKKITIFAISFGLEIITKFLDSYPGYFSNIEDVVSFVGFVSLHDLHISSKLENLLKFVAAGARTRAGSWLYRNIVFQDIFVRPFYIISARNNPKFANLSAKERRYNAKEQSWLWRTNDVRTHAKTAWDFLFVTDLTNLRINFPIIHVGVPRDHLLDNRLVLAGLKKIYSSVNSIELDLPSHAPISLDTEEEVMAIVPDSLAKILTKSDNT